ncbi:MAG TPA: DUF177 domain-containing protein [Elusimicrobiota bacterium]|jgi:uncharacterized protein|nr:DUF177 domain-containing protein [Elusimicrobiota bacterium]
MSASPLRFETRAIREQEGLSQELSVEPALLAPEGAGEARLTGPVSARVEFSIGGNRLLVQASFAGVWRLPCGRCLAAAEAPFSCEFEETYPASDEVIDLTEDARQAVLLELPQRALCKDACRGLCPSCGKNLNEGACKCAPANASPFAVLKSLKKPKEN